MNHTKALRRLGSLAVATTLVLAVAGLIYAQVNIERPPAIPASGVVSTFSDFGMTTPTSSFVPGQNTVYVSGRYNSSIPYEIEYIEPNRTIVAIDRVTIDSSSFNDTQGYGLSSTAPQGNWTVIVVGQNGVPIGRATFYVGPSPDCNGKNCIPDLPSGALPLLLIPIVYILSRYRVRTNGSYESRRSLNLHGNSSGQRPQGGGRKRA